MPDWGAVARRGWISTPTTYYANPLAEGDTKKSWEDLPADIKNTFDRLGIPKAERTCLQRVSAPGATAAPSTTTIRDDLSKKGVIFTDTDTAIKEHSTSSTAYFGKDRSSTTTTSSPRSTAPSGRGAASSTSLPALMRGIPLQADRIGTRKNVGQFERTLIIADKGAKVHYIEGCTAPIYSTNSLHAAVVEVVADPTPRSATRPSRNWSKNVYNLVTKRAVAYENSLVASGAEREHGQPRDDELMPSEIYSEGSRSEGRHSPRSISRRNGRQIIDLWREGGPLQRAEHRRARSCSKSVAIRGGQTSYREKLHVRPGRRRERRHAVRCDALLPTTKAARAFTPTTRSREEDATVSR